MSPSSLRVLAAAAAAVFVLLTAIAVGVVSRPETCTTPGPGPGQSAPPSPSPSPSVSQGFAAPPPGGLGGIATEQRNSPQVSAPPAPPAAGGNAPAQAAPAEPVCEKGPFAARPAVVALFGAGLATLVAFALLLLAGAARPRVQVPVSAPPAGAGPRPGGPLEADRTALVRACIYVRDRVTSRALADRLAAALHDAGVSVVEPVGERFDPSRHEAGGTTPTTDAKRAGTIAAVEVPGYTDRGGRVLRAPVVTVYQAPSTTQRPARSRAEEDR